MAKNVLNSKDIANTFKDCLDDENIISNVFDEVGFDCTVRCFVDPNELDEKIRLFYDEKSVDRLADVIELMLKGKNDAFASEKLLLKDIENYISENLSENITVEQIAEQNHISYYYLCHLFKRLSGQTLNQFIIVKRLERAVRLLSSGDSKISDVALMCGFDSVSYFSETFAKHIGQTPSEFRKNHSDFVIHPFYNLEDMLLAQKVSSMRFLENLQIVGAKEGQPYVKVYNPSDELGNFLHEAAIIEFEGVLYASWYNCPKKELIGYTPIVGKRSYDGGKTWTEPEVIAEDKSGAILYCPPVYGVSDGKLYLMMNQMVAPDHIHSLDLYVLNKETDRFEFVWSRPVPFKLNTNVVSLPNGKLLLPGRIGELDGFPRTPAVMISDSGKMDAEWRVVNVAESGNLPDGSCLVHPEATAICCDGVLYMFNRNDQRNIPILHVSNDMGETWSELISHDIPYRKSKIYCGTLSDGRNYLVANTDDPTRAKLSLYISEAGKMKFTKKMLLIDCEQNNDGITACHYPGAVESDGKLYIIATANYNKADMKGRGAILFTLDTKNI